MAVRVLKDLLTDLPDVPLIHSGVTHAANGCSGAGAVRSGRRRNNSESCQGISARTELPLYPLYWAVLYQEPPKETSRAVLAGAWVACVASP